MNNEDYKRPLASNDPGSLPLMSREALTNGLIGSALLWVVIVLLVAVLAGCHSVNLVGIECRDYTIHVDSLTFEVDSITYTLRDVETAEECKAGK